MNRGVKILVRRIHSPFAMWTIPDGTSTHFAAGFPARRFSTR